MPFPLHKSPLGLLDLFRLRTLGEQPNLFGETVIPVVEVGAFYGADILVGTTSPPTVGALLNLTEAINFAARAKLLAISGKLTIGAAAATNVVMEVGIQLPSNASPQHVMGQAQFPAVAAGQIVGCASYSIPNGGYVINRGAQIYARVGGTAAGADHSLELVALYENIAADGG